MDQGSWLEDVRSYHTTLHNLALIGVGGHPHPRIRPRFAPHFPLAQHRRCEKRDHACLSGIDDNLIWLLVSRSIPDLIPQLRVVLQEVEG